MDNQKRSQILDDHPQAETDAFQVGEHQTQTRTKYGPRAPEPGSMATAEIAPPLPKKRRVKWHLLVCGSLVLLLLVYAAGLVLNLVTIEHNVTAFHVGKQQNVSQLIGGGGIVFPRQQFDLSYPVAERIVSVLVKAGDTVKANQPLIKLDPSQLNAQVNQAANNVSAAQAYLYSVSNAFPYNPVTVAAAQQAVTVAQNHYNALVAQTSNSSLQNGNLISPLAGVVTIVNVNPGQVFGANTILLSVMDESTVTVRAKIPLNNLSQVHLNMPATVTPSALPNLTLTGTVVSIIPQADPQTDTFEAWVQINNPQQKLLPGMSAFVNIQGQVKAYVLPRLAVLNPDHESSVFVIRDGHAYMQSVHVVGRSDNSVYIDAGLAADDALVLLPLNRMHQGQSVTITANEQ